MDRNQRRGLLTWLTVGPLFVLCGILALLQYQWIGEVSVAERERLRASLQASLARLSLDFNAEITAVCRALAAPGPEPDPLNLEKEIERRFALWKKGTRHPSILESVSLADPSQTPGVLKRIDPSQGVFRETGWPAAWAPIRRRMGARMAGHGRGVGAGPGPGPGFDFGMPPPEDQSAAGLPFVIFVPRHAHPGGFGGRDASLLLLEFNQDYLKQVLLPEVLQRHLGAGGTLEYQAWVVTQASPEKTIFGSEPNIATRAGRPDATVNLFELSADQMLRRPGGAGRGPGPGPGWGRWRLSVRHQSGSLEAVVNRARVRNLAVTTGVLVLMLAAMGALIHFTRRSQLLAALQMDFVAGVSHELRTPLTVIYTAAFNLQGNVARNPAQVERYGALIQQESGRLKELVEQVLRFAGAEAGRVLQDKEPVSIQAVIEESLESTRAAIEAAGSVVEKQIEAHLPPVTGDRIALKLAVQNLIENAAKYGTEGGRWIGVTASSVPGQPAAVEIAVADRGPGIPSEEQKQIFDPFVRGRQAVKNQVRGTGLGLNLVKKIVEAHGGSVSLRSELMKGSVFIVRLPAAGGATP